MSGAVRQRTTKKQAERVTASGQFRFPSCCGDVPAKSISISSPAIVTAARISRVALERLEHVGRLVATVRKRRGGQPARAARSTRTARPSPPRRVARPCASQSSTMRRSASRCAPICARRSPSRSSGLRMFATTRRRTSSSSKTGGMMTPSWYSSRDSAGRLDGSIPPTSAWWARDTANPTWVRETSVMSGRCVPPVNGSLTAKISPGAGSRSITAATASGIAPRWTGMCSAWATHPARVVEEGGRAVAPLLDVRRERGADQRRAHLLSDRQERAADDLEFDFHVLVRISVLFPSLSPSHPGGTQQVAPASSRTAGPVTRRGRPAAASTGGPGSHVGGSDGDELDRSVAIRVAVSLLVSAVERLGEIATERDGQLERLAPVAEVGLALGRQLAPTSASGRTYDVTWSRRSSLATRPERGEHAGCGRYEHRPDPQLFGEGARVQRPGAAEGHEREVPGILAPLDRDHPKRAQHLGVDDVHDRRGIEAAERALGRVASRESMPPGSVRRKPPEEEVRVGDGRSRRRRARSRLGPGGRRRSPGPTRSAPPASTPGDRPAAGTDGVDVDARKPNRKPADVTFGRALDLPARDEADIGRRPSHVERDRVRRIRRARRRGSRRRRRRPGPRRGSTMDGPGPPRPSRRRPTSA